MIEFTEQELLLLENKIDRAHGLLAEAAYSEDDPVDLLKLGANIGQAIAEMRFVSEGFRQKHQTFLEMQEEVNERMKVYKQKGERYAGIYKSHSQNHEPS